MKIPIYTDKNKFTYDVLIGDLPDITIDKEIAIITNDTVSKLHLDKLLSKLTANKITVVTIPDGERYKNMKTIESILDQLFEAKLTRDSLLIAFGGGVIGDMTGFTASIYQRGIDFIQIPTTLLSQVDASVGGKTGINSKYGKNLIGTFHQPSGVYTDPSFLKTLPDNEFSAGFAEVIKMFVMFDKKQFEALETINTKEMIISAISIKSSIINQDEKEEGIRMVLNYGHTFGHIIENETNYEKYLHGEAVSIGMVMANKLAVKLNLLTKDEELKIKDLLVKNNLPIDYKINNMNSFYEKLFLDKKSKNGIVSFILPNGIGDYKIVSDIDKEIIMDVLKEYSV